MYRIIQPPFSNREEITYLTLTAYNFCVLLYVYFLSIVFQSEFSTECDLVFSLSTSSIFSFP
jgi:hypothetical protein